MANKNKKNGGGMGIVAAGAAIAAGYYFYLSKNAKKNRKIVATWATNLKDDVLDKAETLKENLNRDSLIGIIDEIAETYYTAKNVRKEDVKEAVDELKENWEKVLKELKSGTSKPIKAVGTKAKARKKDSGE
jgi:hypothetical protein